MKLLRLRNTNWMPFVFREKVEEKATKDHPVPLDHLERLEKTEDPDPPDLLDLRLVITCDLYSSCKSHCGCNFDH